VTTPANSVDWERIEADYRAGILSVREIAASQGITHGAIQKRAKRDGWVRDLSQKIQAKADALVANREVASQVATAKAATEKVIVEANAEVIAAVRMSHRQDIKRYRDLASKLLEELEKASSKTSRIDAFKKLTEAAKVLFALEREAYGITGDQAKEGVASNLASRMEIARKRLANGNG